MPVPANVRGTRSDIQLVTSSQGRPFADSITVCGIKNLRYSRQLAKVAAQYECEPAKRDGLPVAAPYRLLYVF